MARWRCSALILCVLLVDCAGINGVLDQISRTGAAPVVRGTDGGSASLVLIVCPRTAAGIEAAQAVLDRMIEYGAEIVLARGGGSAKLTIDACPAGIASAPPQHMRK
jgi:hypothetical protein